MPSTNTSGDGGSASVTTAAGRYVANGIRSLTADLMAGAIVAALNVALAVSFAALLFQGELRDGFAMGLWALLLSMVVTVGWQLPNRREAHAVGILTHDAAGRRGYVSDRRIALGAAAALRPLPSGRRLSGRHRLAAHHHADANSAEADCRPAAITRRTTRREGLRGCGLSAIMFWYGCRFSS